MIANGFSPTRRMYHHPWFRFGGEIPSDPTGSHRHTEYNWYSGGAESNGIADNEEALKR